MEDIQIITISNFVIMKMESAKFSLVCRISTAPSNLMAIKHTPTIPTDTAKMWIQVPSSNCLLEFR